MNEFSAIPAELKTLRQWVCWTYGASNAEGKRSKIPLNPITGYGASSTNPQTWTSFTEAFTRTQNTGLCGVGFVFSESDNYCGVDLDDAINEAGEISDFAAAVMKVLDSYTELSTSGRGFHVIIKIGQSLSTIGNGNKLKFGNSDFECYDKERYFIMTGKPYGEIKPIGERTEALKKIYAQYFPTQQPAKKAGEISWQRKTQTPPPVLTCDNDTDKNYSGVDERDITEAFFKSLSDYGITPRENFTPILDGEIHRFSTIEDKHGESSGTYYIHIDGWPNWGVKDFRKYNEMQKIKYPFTINERREYLKRTSPAQREQIRYEAEALRAKNLKRKQELEKQRQEQALQEYYAPNWGDADEHPYIAAKNIQHLLHFIYEAPFYGPRIKTKKLPEDFCETGDLLIPLTNIQTGEFQTLQRIYSIPNEVGKFLKSFYPDISSSGACVQISTVDCRKYDDSAWPKYELKSEIIFIAEGIATGLSLFEFGSYKYPVICAMTCANFMNVAKILREKHKNSYIIIGADNDRAGNETADKVISAGYADAKKTPPVAGMDWNDYANSN